MTPHHGDNGNQREIAELRKRFLQQIDGTAKREYPNGRMGADDDGALVYAVAVDRRHRTIVIRFGKPVEWMGLDIEAAEKLRDALTDKLLELRGITV